MVGDGTTIELAIAALFDLCIPTASSGQIEQTFPDDLVVPLTQAEANDYAETIKGCQRVLKIKSEDGIILFALENGWCKVITADGNPVVALETYLCRLRTIGGHESSRESLGEWLNVHGTIPVNDSDIIVVVFAADMSNPDAGFYGSAALARKKRLG
jgi:hypothetical protein